MAITISGDTPNFSAATITTGTVTNLTSTTGTITTLTSTTISDGTNSISASGVISGSIKAWARFAGATATIAASYNVSSITRTSQGVYAANFTNALPQSNFVITGSANGNQALFYNDGTASTTAAPFRTAAGGTNFDYSSIEFMVIA
jgi:hypothetical protein